VRHPFFDGGRPLVFAHRGGAGLAPENTIEAFDSGLALGADGLELDVRAARDGVVVVHHDPTVDRTTNLRGRVSCFTSGELARADAGYHFGSGGARPFRGLGIGVPTLASVLARYRDHRIILELKETARDFARAVLEVVRAADASDRVCLGSYSVRVLRAARGLAPAVATSAARVEVRWALYRSWCRWPITRVSYAGFQVPEVSGGTRVVSRHFVEAAHSAGLGVQVWTVDDEGDGRRLLDWGIDALITDRPDVIVPVARALKP
jgi:glycerophosphoryl diester phosphodiesterase